MVQQQLPSLEEPHDLIVWNLVKLNPEVSWLN